MFEMNDRAKARFWIKAKQSKYCWDWIGAKNADGYGMFRHGGECHASRIAYQIMNGPISKDVCVCHHCDNPGCVNPDHLFIATHHENMMDKVKKGRSRFLGRVSQHMGVTWRNDSKRWRGYITIDRKMKNLGSFGTEIEAAKAHDKAAFSLFGSKARLNFPKDWPPK